MAGSNFKLQIEAFIAFIKMNLAEEQITNEVLNGNGLFLFDQIKIINQGELFS